MMRCQAAETFAGHKNHEEKRNEESCVGSKREVLHYTSFFLFVVLDRYVFFLVSLTYIVYQRLIHKKR